MAKKASGKNEVTVSPSDAVKMSAMELGAQFDGMFKRAVDALDLAHEKQPVLGKALRDVAVGLEAVLGQMAEERERVAQLHPWQYGYLFDWLCDVVGQGDDGKPITRFEVFQNARFWDDISFPAWARMHSGVDDATWQNWQRAAHHVLRTEQGARLAEVSGVDQGAIPSLVKIGKAVRAVPAIADGSLSDSLIKAKAFTDPSITETSFRHMLRSTDEQIEKAEREHAAREQEWVDTGRTPTGEIPQPQIMYDPSQFTVKVRIFSEGGEFKDTLVCRFPIPASPVVDCLIAAMVAAARSAASAWREPSLEPVILGEEVPAEAENPLAQIMTDVMSEAGAESV